MPTTCDAPVSYYGFWQTLPQRSHPTPFARHVCASNATGHATAAPRTIGINPRRIIRSPRRGVLTVPVQVVDHARGPREEHQTIFASSVHNCCAAVFKDCAGTE